MPHALPRKYLPLAKTKLLFSGFVHSMFGNMDVFIEKRITKRDKIRNKKVSICQKHLLSISAKFMLILFHF